MPRINIDLIRLQFLKDIDHEVTDRLHRNIRAFTKQEHQNLKEYAKELDTQDYDNSLMLDDEHYYLDEVNKLAAELLIVALYKKVEITVKKAIRVGFKNIDDKKLFQIKELKKELIKENINIESLTNYKAMDELRCINNCIKHSGTVNNELSKYPGWTKGAKLGDLDQTYNSLAPKSIAYINEVVDTIIKNVKQKIAVSA